MTEFLKGYFDTTYYLKLTQNLLNFLIFKIFVGKLTKNGKKLKALNFSYFILLNLRTNFLLKNILNLKIIKEIDGAITFFLAIKFILPIFRIVQRKVAGTIYNLPYPLLKPKNSITKGLKNLISNGLKRNVENTLVQKLTNEIIESVQKKSTTFLNKITDYKIGFRGMPFLRYLIRNTSKNKFTSYNFFKRNVGKKVNFDSFGVEEFKLTTNKTFQNKTFLMIKEKYFRQKVRNNLNYFSKKKKRLLSRQKESFFLTEKLILLEKEKLKPKNFRQLKKNEIQIQNLKEIIAAQKIKEKEEDQKFQSQDLKFFNQKILLQLKTKNYYY